MKIPNSCLSYDLEKYVKDMFKIMFKKKYVKNMFKAILFHTEIKWNIHYFRPFEPSAISKSMSRVFRGEISALPH